MPDLGRSDPATIMVVDDDADIRNLILGQLRQEGDAKQRLPTSVWSRQERVFIWGVYYDISYCNILKSVDLN